MDYYLETTNGFVAILDIHYGKKCNIRLDDTEEVISNKMSQILDYCLDNNVKVVLVAGDIFDNCSISRKSFIKAYETFSKFKKYEIDLYVIYGNHDEYRYNKDFRSETPLRDLKTLGAVKIIDSQDSVEILDEQNNKYMIYGFPYLETAKLKETVFEKESGYKNVVIAHTFYDNEFMGGENNLTKEDIQRINADYYILGHDHSYYPEERIGDKRVFRFGSLVRGTSSKNDLERDVIFMHFHDGEYEEIKLDVEKLENVTVAKATIKEEKIDYKEIIEEIKISEDDKIDTVMDAVNKIENKEVREIIRRNI